MTEEIIQAIKLAEAQAQEIKREAENRAHVLVADAESEATRVKDTAREVCKAYADSALKNAKAEAERRYNDALLAREKTAREYCAKVLQNADTAVSEIVGRVLSGNR